MRGLIKGTLVLGMAAVTLSGCGGGNSTVKTTYYRFKAIDIQQATADTFTQTGRLGFSYLANGKLDRLTHYYLAGTDGKWGTDDDKSDYFVSCSFTTEKGPSTSLDIEGELSEGLRPLYLTAPAGLAAIPMQDVAGACQRGYSGQAGLTQKVFTSGADGKAGTADDVQQIRLDWSSVSVRQSHLNVTAPDFAGDSRDFYYQKSLNGIYRYIVTSGLYRRYTFKADYQGLTAIDRRTTAIDPATWLMELDTDTPLDSIVFTAASVNSNYRCSRNAANLPLKNDLVIISGNLPAAVFHLGTGLDGAACTADDDNAILSKELYILEEAN